MRHGVKIESYEMSGDICRFLMVFLRSSRRYILNLRVMNGCDFNFPDGEGKIFIKIY